MIDYKELLKKYVNHVDYNAGITFLGRNFNSSHLTKEEQDQIAELVFDEDEK